MIKTLLYCAVFPFTIWALEGLDLNRFFKQSRVLQARIIYLLLCMSVSYLVVNFLYDFAANCPIIK